MNRVPEGPSSTKLVTVNPALSVWTGIGLIDDIP